MLITLLALGSDVFERNEDDYSKSEKEKICCEYPYHYPGISKCLNISISEEVKDCGKYCPN